jgi:hypothetical protein
MSRVSVKIVIGLYLLSVQPVQALESGKQTVPADLDRAWQQYLASDSNRDPAADYPHEKCFRQAALAHDIPVTLLLAVARGESDFNPRAISSANALGLMQILWPGTARHLGITRKSDLFKPCINIDAGARYLNELMRHYDDNLHRTLAAYNYGPGRIPVNQSSIPKGAKWYSGYIFRHMRTILNRENPKAQSNSKDLNQSERKLPLITFSTPYRAEAFVARIEQHHPGVQLAWFKTSTSRFEVVMLYGSKDDLTRGRSLLAQAGFRVN